MMRTVILAVSLCCGFATLGVCQIPSDSATLQLRAELRVRADSIARLDPARELAHALERGDRRFIGLQGYSQIAPGLDHRHPLYPKQGTMRIVEGTSDSVWAPEVKRLNEIAAEYATRYNRMLVQELQRGKPDRSRPAT